MSHLLAKRPRLAVAGGLALAVLLVLATGVAVTSGACLVNCGGIIRSGHTVKAVKIATDEVTAIQYYQGWNDVPGMAVTMSVPENTQALFLITFSAENVCSAVVGCEIQALVNSSVAAPGQVIFGKPDEDTNSMQFVSSPMPAGTYTIKIQYLAFEYDNPLTLYKRTLSVLRSVV